MRVKMMSFYLKMMSFYFKMADIVSLIMKSRLIILEEISVDNDGKSTMCGYNCTS